MRYLTAGFTVCLLFFSIQLLTLGQNINISEPVAPPIQVRNTFDLDPFYEQWIDVGGLPVVASAKVNPYALKEAVWLIRQMIGHRPEVLRTLAQNNVRFAVMAHNELTTDIPEHSDLQPPDYWDRRARGLGPTPIRPAVSCGEENLLNYPGDPYSTENILVHEFAHAIHEMALNTIIPDFDNRLAATFTAAKQKGLWRNTYAMTNKEEYWAEGTQSWFDTNRANDSEHNHVDTRDKLKRYDPALAKLLKEIFGDTDWRYTRALTRLHLSHLQGFNPQQSPTFLWPLDLEACSQQLTDPDNTGDIAFIDLEPYNLGLLPCLKSRGTDVDAVVTFENQTGGDILYYWINFEGNAQLFGEVAANDLYEQSTYVGNVWLVKNRKGKNLAVFSAVAETGRVIIGTTPAPFAEADLAEAGPKIEGPWLWMVVPTARKGVVEVAASGKDYLATASKRAVTEQQIAMKGATVGERVKNRVWTFGKLAPTGGNNITDMVNAIGLKKGNIDYHVAYGSITLDAPRRQNTQMYVGSDDSVKVWLNGVLVYNKPADRPANNYQEGFPVTLKKGKNILFVAVYNGIGWWSGFFGFKKDAVYSLLLTPIVHIQPARRPSMYWVAAETGALYRLVGTEVENLVPGVQKALGLAVDTTNSHIYWTEQTGKNKGSVKTANLDGTNVQILATLKSVPTSIAVDAAKSKLYWTNASGRIQRANLNGKQIRTLAKNLKAPSNITLDTTGGKLYWTESNGRIRRANLNGKGLQNIASDLDPINGIAIAGNKIYWAEGTDGGGGKIRHANLNGSNFGTLVSFQQVPSGVAIDPVGNKLYWTEANGSIRRANLNGKNIQNVVSGLVSPNALVLGNVNAGPAAPTNGSLASFETATPDGTLLFSNYPNPFNPETWIPYHLAEPADVTLTIYAVDGKIVRRLDLGYQAAGFYQRKSRAAYWDGRNNGGERVASGLYFYTLTAGDFSATQKMLIQK